MKQPVNTDDWSGKVKSDKAPLNTDVWSGGNGMISSSIVYDEQKQKIQTRLIVATFIGVFVLGYLMNKELKDIV